MKKSTDYISVKNNFLLTFLDSFSSVVKARTEGAFYLRFEQMPAEDKELLKSYHGVGEDWQVFKKICAFWNVK